MLIDLTIIVLAVTVSLTLIIGIYFTIKARKKRETPDEYTPIYLSIGGLDRRLRELKRFVEDLALKIEKLSLDLDDVKNEKNIQPLVEGLKKTMEVQVSLSRSLQALKDKVLSLEKKFSENILQSRISQRKIIFEEERGKWGGDIKDIKFARLTATEMKVLKVLATSGPKTASEIREIIGKTREHSGRLMKKLFLEGYVERDTTTIPYTYRISKRIKDSLELSGES